MFESAVILQSSRRCGVAALPRSGCPNAACVKIAAMASRPRLHTLLTVRRRCLVCEHVDEGEEPEGADAIGAPCSSCNAPTERIDILARRTKPIALNPHAAALGRLGGQKGGPARAAVLTREQRREIARRAARKRWGYED